MKIYVAAFMASLLVGLTAAFMISGTVGPELDAITGAFSKELETTVERDPTQPVLEPAILLTFKNAEALSEDLSYATYALGLKRPAAKSVTNFIQTYRDGLDDSKPAAVAMFFREGKIKPTLLFCLPINDRKTFETALNKFGSVYEERGEKKIAIEGLGTLQLMHRGQFMFISGNGAIFERIPDDQSLIESFASQYDIGFRVDPSLIPDDLKHQLLSAVKQGAYQNSRHATESELATIRQWLAKTQSMLFDTKKFVAGFNIDVEARSFTLETELLGEPDSLIAEDANKNLMMEASQFSGFYREGAGVNLTFCNNTGSTDLFQIGNTVEETLNQVKNMTLESGPSDSETQNWFGDMGTVLNETIDANRFDFGLTGNVYNGKLNIVMGFHIADPTRFQKAFIDRFRSSGLNGPSTVFRARIANHRDVVFHQIETRLPGDDGFRNLFGDKLIITIGIGKSAGYFGLGENGLELLQQSIDDSANAPATTPVTVKCDGEFSAWLDLIPDTTPDSRYVRSLIQNSAEFDRFSFESFPIENGYKSRLNVEMGFARITWKSIKRGIDRYVQNFGSHGGPVRVNSSENQVPFSSMMKAHRFGQ